MKNLFTFATNKDPFKYANPITYRKCKRDQSTGMVRFLLVLKYFALCLFKDFFGKNVFKNLAADIEGTGNPRQSAVLVSLCLLA
jgi:hypothetical protein